MGVPWRPATEEEKFTVERLEACGWTPVEFVAVGQGDVLRFFYGGEPITGNGHPCSRDEVCVVDGKPFMDEERGVGWGVHVVVFESMAALRRAAS